MSQSTQPTTDDRASPRQGQVESKTLGTIIPDFATLIHMGQALSRARTTSAVVVLIAIASVAPPSHGEGVAAPGQFLEKYRSAIRRLEHSTENIWVEGVLSRQSEYPARGGAPKLHKDNLSYAGVRGKEKFSIVGTDEKLPTLGKSGAKEDGAPVADDYFERIFVLGGTWNFVVRRATRGGSYYLESETIPKNQLQVLNNYKRVTVAAIYNACYSDFTNLVSSKDFVIKTFRETLDEKGRPLFHIEFEHKPVPSKISSGRARVYHTTGTIVLDPTRQMAIRESDVRKVNSSDPKTFTSAATKLVYAEGSDLPVPSAITCRTNSSNIIKSTYNFQVTRWDYGRAPQHGFTLDDYGLGDLEFPDGRGGSWHGVAISVFIVSGIGLLLSLAARRKRGKGTDEKGK